MRFVGLVRFYLRRYRTLFLALLALILLHDLAFACIFKFWQKQIEMADLFLRILPGRIRESMGMPITDLRDPVTFKALVYLRPDLRALTLVFGVAVGTDVIAGEVGRGTADLLYSHPVRRRTAVLAAAFVALLHLVCVGVVMLLGFKLATLVFPMGENQPTLAQLGPSVANIVLASFAICLTAFLAGSLCSTRGRAVGVSLLFILVPMVLDFMGFFTGMFTQVARLFPEHYYRPHLLLAGAGRHTFADYAVASCIIGGAVLVGAVFVAERRDLVK